MNVLIIDTATRTTTVSVSGQHGLTTQWGKEEVRADDVLKLIDQVLHEQSAAPTELAGILVRIGLGSYTGLRVGVTVANTLGWALGIPIEGFVSRSLKPVDPRRLRARLTLFRSKIRDSRFGMEPPAGGQWLVPKYRRWQAHHSSGRIRLHT